MIQSQLTVPKLLDPPPGMMSSDFGASFPHSPLDDQMCSMFVNDYSAPGSPEAILGLMDDIRVDPSNKEMWKLLPTPPRSPDHYYYGCGAPTATLAIDNGSSAAMGSAGALGQTWAGLGLDELVGSFEDPPEVPSAEEQEAICAILFEHDDFIDRLLNDDTVLDSVLGGSSASDEVDSMAAVEDWSSPTSPTQPAVKSELLHDCMWSGQCTDDCKQKAAREKRQALVATPTSSFDVVVSPESAMPPRSQDVLVANPLFASSSSRTVVGAPSSRTSLMADDEPAATQCVDPSSVLGYTPLSDHSYHQATTSAPPTPPDSPRAVTQQGSSSASGAGSGSTSSPPLLVVRRRNGVWKREVIMSDTPSESDEDDDEDDEDEEPEQMVAEEEQQPDDDDDDDDEDDDDDDDDDDDEEIDVVTVSGERHHGGRHGASAPAVLALPANGGSVNTIRCAGRLPRVIMGSAPAVVSRMTSSGRVVTPSHKALTNSQTQRRRRRRGAELAATSSSSAAGGKRKRPRHHHSRHHHGHYHSHHGSTPSSPQSKRSRRDDDSSSSSSSSSQSAGRRGGHHHHHHHHPLSQLPPSAKRNEHNTMERKRRDDLRVAFQELREKVPLLADNKKAAKVTILNEAANYAVQLTVDVSKNEQKKKQEEQRQQVLKRRLAVLQQQQQQQQLRARHQYRR